MQSALLSTLICDDNCWYVPLLYTVSINLNLTVFQKTLEDSVNPIRIGFTTTTRLVIVTNLINLIWVYCKCQCYLHVYEPWPAFSQTFHDHGLGLMMNRIGVWYIGNSRVTKFCEIKEIFKLYLYNKTSTNFLVFNKYY